MADTNSPVPDGWTAPIGSDGQPLPSSSWVPPTDKQIPYTVNGMGTPSITSPGGVGMPGHQSTVDPRKVQGQAAALHKANVAAAQARSDAQRARDAAGARFTPKFTPKKGK